MKYMFFLLVICSTAWAQDPSVSMQRLIDGNRRYANDDMQGPRRDIIRREATVSKQEPFAAIVTCSDSRVAPEILFDQGVGDLFVVRVAGNVVGPVEMDSVEYAVIYLHASAILVMGHENCGAVQAVMQGQTKDIEAVAELVQPNIQGITNVREAIEANVRGTMARIKESKVLSKLIDEGKLKIAGGYYHLDSGMVNILDAP